MSKRKKSYELEIFKAKFELAKMRYEAVARYYPFLGGRRAEEK